MLLAGRSAAVGPFLAYPAAITELDDLRFAVSWTTISSSYTAVVLPQFVIKRICFRTGGRG